MEQLDSRLCLSAVTFIARPIEQTELREPASIVNLDVDLDGHMDLVTSSSEGVIWLRNQNGMAFEITDSIGSEQGVLKVVDVDADGHEDLLLHGNELLWYPNAKGTGHFEPARRVRTVASPLDLDAGDVDGDGDTDLVTTNADRNAIGWYENTDGLGAFNTFHTIFEGANVKRSVHVADIDGDGDLDVVATSFGRTGRLAWYRNEDASGTFGPPIVIQSVRNLGLIQSADFDGDGDLDVVVGAERQFVWYENTDGQGVFRAAQQMRGFQSGFGPTMTPADMDGDGDFDLVVSYSYSTDIDDPRRSGLGWYENADGLGAFREFEPILGAGDSHDLTVADFDRDGDLDIISTGLYSGRLEWVRNPDGDLSQAPIEYVFFSADDATDAVFGDLDNDGDSDLVVTLSRQRMIAIYWNSGHGDFGTPTTVTGVFSPSRIAAADLDGDGDSDLVSAGFRDFDYNANKLDWYENLSDQSFGPRQEISRVPFRPYNLDPVDVDHDGDLDILMQREEPIVWLANLNGTFDTEVRIATAQQPFSMRSSRFPIVDLDGDGDLDLTVYQYDAMSDAVSLVWYPGDLTGFGMQQVIDRRDSRRRAQLAAADLDSDGDVDLISGSDESIEWYENLGAGAFSPARLIRRLGQERFTVNGLIADDFDADGDADIFYSNKEHELTLLINQDGLGTFIDTGVTIGIPGAQRLISSDVDVDGNVDLLAVSSLYNRAVGRYEGSVTWFEQRVIGDANDDGVFNSFDLTFVFQAGKYKDGVAENAIFNEGDWNQDGDFESGDLVFAFQAGTYQAVTPLESLNAAAANVKSRAFVA